MECIESTMLSSTAAPSTKTLPNKTKASAIQVHGRAESKNHNGSYSIVDSMHSISSKAKNLVTHSQSSYIINSGVHPGGLVVLTNNIKVSVLKVWFSADWICIDEEPQ